MKFIRSIMVANLIALQLFYRCTSDSSKTDGDLYQGKPTANIEMLVTEVENGGFNQYFFNSSGVDWFETLRALESDGKSQTAQILRQAINLINPGNLPESQLVDRLRRREVTELDNQEVSTGLSKLDSLFYTEPDGPLIP
jgi:hypothetical protein